MTNSSLRPRRRTLAAGLAAVILLAGAAGAGMAAGAGGSTKPSDAAVTSEIGAMSLADAIRASTAVGPVPAGQVIDLTLALRTRRVAQLEGMILANRRVTPSRYLQTFGPSPSELGLAIAELRNAGLRVTAPAGRQILSVTGSAKRIESAFGVRLEDYAPKGGVRFFAPMGRPVLKGAVARVVSSVVGLDDHARSSIAGLTHDSSMLGLPGGYSPGQVFEFYNFDPLHKAGLDGAGETVLFLEIDKFSPSDLDLYASHFHLSSFQVTVHSSASYGQPAGTEGEANLDLEIVHATAPAAKLVVYYAGPGTTGEVAAYSAMLNAYPHAILSDSIGGCELGSSTFSTATEPLFRRFAATGGTVFNAAGDSGAFTCTRGMPVAHWDPSKQKPNVSNPSDDPWVTAVGGTSIFPSRNGGYGREAVWGNPIEQAGGGGGLSAYFRRPSYQKGPGVINQFSNGMRQVPDVSALGDTNTGWDIASNGQFQLIGGTSTGAPLWAGLAALADQALAQHGRQAIGFVNPALYYFGSHPNSIKAPAFHDVMVGNNLYYPGTPHWDFATGLGTPNAAALVDDLLTYEPKR